MLKPTPSKTPGRTHLRAANPARRFVGSTPSDGKLIGTDGAEGWELYYRERVSSSYSRALKLISVIPRQKGSYWFRFNEQTQSIRALDPDAASLIKHHPLVATWVADRCRATPSLDVQKALDHYARALA